MRLSFIPFHHKHLAIAVPFLLWSLTVPVSSVFASSILSDRSLSDRSQVFQQRRQGRAGFVITGGTQKGSNLFHSFAKFSIPSRQIASFEDILPTVKNVFARVTGDSISTLDGEIELLNAFGRTSQANLFLLNPHGIRFKSNASVQRLQGSFIATTGRSISFKDRKRFSVEIQTGDSKLPTKTPQSIQFGDTPGLIRLDQANFVQPRPGRSLLLVGGQVIFSRTNLLATDARVEVAGIDTNQSVALLNQPTVRLQLISKPTLAPLHFVDGSSITVIGGLNTSLAAGVYLSGSQVRLTDGSALISRLLPDKGQGWPINIQATQLQVLDTSFIFSDNLTDRTGGSISLNADKLQVDCALARENCAIILSNSQGSGRAGNISVAVRELMLQDGGQIASLSSPDSNGNPGNLQVNGDDIHIEGGFILDGDWRASGVIVENRNNMRSGRGITPRIDVKAQQLTLRDGGLISSATFNANRAGNINVRAQNVDIIGNALNSDGSLVQGTPNLPNLPISSGIFTSVDPGASGSGGTLFLRTQNLRVLDGGKLQATTFGGGKAGEIKIRSNFVTVSGTDIEAQFPSTIFSGSGGIPGLILGNQTASGQGGDVTIKTNNLLVSNSGAIAVGSLNPNPSKTQGAGNINISAETVVLNNGGRLLSDTASGNGGNIDLAGYQNASHLTNLFLLNSGQISATAGQEEAGGDGGDVNINADAILTNLDPRPNASGSDITANAFDGTGGNIRISANLLLGIRPRSADPFNQTNDIDASSQLGAPGTVDIDANLVDPTQAIVDLPTGISVPTVARQCDRQTAVATSSLTDSGKGGVAKTPTSFAQMNQAWEDLRLAHNEPKVSVTSKNRSEPSRGPLIEAEGFTRSPSGQLMLVAKAPKVQTVQLASRPCLNAQS